MFSFFTYGVLYMGTRAIVDFYDEGGRSLATLYIKFDGYPDGNPLKIIHYLTNRRFQSAHDLAVKVISAMMKKSAREVREAMKNCTKDKDVCLSAIPFLLIPPGTRGLYEEFVYEIRPQKGGRITIRAYAVYGIGKKGKKKLIFRGTPEEYVKGANLLTTTI